MFLPVSTALFSTFAARFMKPTVSAIALADTLPARSLSSIASVNRVNVFAVGDCALGVPRLEKLHVVEHLVPALVRQCLQLSENAVAQVLVHRALRLVSQPFQRDRLPRASMCTYGVR